MQLPFASIRDLDHQHQQRYDQTLAKWQSFPLDGKQCKWAKTPPQPDPHNTHKGGLRWKNARVRTMGAPELEANAANGNLIGCRARVANETRVAGIPKARRSPRAIGMMNTGHVAWMRHVNRGSDHLGLKRRHLTSALQWKHQVPQAEGRGG